MTGFNQLGRMAGLAGSNGQSWVVLAGLVPTVRRESEEAQLSSALPHGSAETRLVSNTLLSKTRHVYEGLEVEEERTRSRHATETDASGMRRLRPGSSRLRRSQDEVAVIADGLTRDLPARGRRRGSESIHASALGTTLFGAVGA